MAADRDRRRWDLRHRDGVAEPSAPFGWSHLPTDLTDRTGLDVAAGTGGVSLWAAARGMRMTAIDISGVGLRALADAATELDLSERITTVVRDLDHGLGTTDSFDLVVCRNFREPTLYPALRAAIAPGGWLSITVLRSGRFGADGAELLRAFADVGAVVDTATDDRAHHALFHRPA